MFSIAVKRHERIWEDRGKRRAGECRPAPALERYAAQMNVTVITDSSVVQVIMEAIAS